MAIGDGRFLPAPAVLGQLLTQMMPEPRPARARGRRGHRLFGRRARRRWVSRSSRSKARAELAAAARELGVEVVEGRSKRATPKGAPYDQILIDGAVEYIPDAIVDQLADGGRLGAALIDRGITRLIVGRKAGGAFGYLSLGDAGVPALPGFTRPQAFTF